MEQDEFEITIFCSLHDHCGSCWKANCTQGPHDCPVITCEKVCGASFHKCKQSEHNLICLNAQVKCINYSSGCPLLMLRKNLGQHLEKCPASIVICTAGWNRRPNNSSQTLKNVPHSVGNQFHFTEKQLDFALAIRDQRLLNQVTGECVNDNRTSLPTSHPRHLITPVDTSNDEQSHLSSFSHTLTEKDTNLNPLFCDKKISCVFCRKKCLINNQESITNEHLSTVNVIKNEDQSLPRRGENIFEASKVKTDSQREIHDFHDAFSLQDTPQSSTTSQLLTSCAPPCGEKLSFDVAVESIERYVEPKQHSMYTFLCSQIFRRDEYGGHHKNIHVDIHSSLNGWLEHRCPMAEYGCTYSQRRLRPSSSGMTVYYNNILDSFGVTAACPPIMETVESKHDSLDFCSLPTEVLIHIAQYLDGFTLWLLSVTCRRLRGICSTLLEEKGLVVLEWIKQKRENEYERPTWQIAYKVSLFTAVVKRCICHASLFQ